MPKKYIPLKDRPKLFGKEEKLRKKLKTDESLTQEERKNYSIDTSEWVRVRLGQ